MLFIECKHTLIVIQRIGVNGEHACSIADADDFFSGQEVSGISGQGGDECYFSDMFFLIQNGLVQMCNGPSLRNIELEKGSQFCCCRSGDRVSPGTERNKKIHLVVKSEIAMHHGAHAHGADFLEFDAVLCEDISFQFEIAVLQSFADRFHGIRPDTV